MRIAIIGGGFSGTALSAQIIAKSSQPVELYLIEKGAHCGQGVAYATPFACHLLNVRANQMGALSDNPRGFLQWLKANEALWRQADPAFEHLACGPDDFLPRKLYGLYLADLLKQTGDLAAKQGSIFQIVSKHAIDVESIPEKGLRISFQDAQSLEVDKLVLAVGTQVIKQSPFAISSERYISNIWEWDEAALHLRLAQTDRESVVFIIGTGLTMIDMVTALIAAGYLGKIIALSPHGQIPCEESPKPLPKYAVPADLLEHNTLLQKYGLFRNKCSALKMQTGDWRQLIDSLRPYTPRLWGRLSLADKRRFLRHLSSLWNKHRHRMPPLSARLIHRLILENRLQLVAGKVHSLHSKGGRHLEIHYLSKGSSQLQTARVDYAFNCTGPEYAIEKQSDVLLRNLLQRGWIIKDDLGLGVQINAHYAAKGAMEEKICVIGSLLYGERLETTSVPEIRRQASSIASRLLTHLN